MNNELIFDINQSLETRLPEKLSTEELKDKLAAHINYLIIHHFEKLVFYLYRIDVNEAKMRALLEQREGENAPALIADLIIERLEEKIKSRQQFRQRDNNIIDENEKW